MIKNNGGLGEKQGEFCERFERTRQWTIKNVWGKTVLKSVKHTFFMTEPSREQVAKHLRDKIFEKFV